MDGSEKSFTVDNHIKQTPYLLPNKHKTFHLPPSLQSGLGDSSEQTCVIYAGRFGNALVVEWVPRRGREGRGQARDFIILGVCLEVVHAFGVFFFCQFMSEQNDPGN